MIERGESEGGLKSNGCGGMRQEKSSSRGGKNKGRLKMGC